MKKVLFAISVVALALVSCTQFEPETPVTFDRASAPSLTVNVTGDNSVAFEILPGKNTGYYAYAFLKGEVDPATVDAATLLAGKVSGSMDKEVANAAKKDTLKNEVKKLTPNTKYTVVAVAACSTTQTLSKVVGQTVTTSDNTIPAVSVSKATVAVEDSVMVFSVPFDDPITLTDKAAFVIQLYAINYANAAGTLQPIGALSVPADSASVAKDGVTLEVKIPKEVYVPGEFVALNIGPGTVKNDVDSLNAAFTANTLTQTKQSGLVGQFKNVNFDFENPIAEDSLVAFQNPAKVAVELKGKFAGTVNGIADYGDGVVTVKTNFPATGRKVEYTLQNWDVEKTAAQSVILGLDEGADFGVYVSYDIEEGIVEDLFGNVNNALLIEDQMICSYGYTLDDVVGTYSYKFYSNTTGDYEIGELVLEEADKLTLLGDDEEYACNVMFTKYFDMDLNVAPLYAVFDPDAGTITIPDWQQIAMEYIYEGSTPVDANIYIYSTYNNAATGISVPAAGVLDGFDDDAFGLAVYQYTTGNRLGFLWYLTYHAERTGPVPAPAPGPTSAPKAIKKISVEKGTLPKIK